MADTTDENTLILENAITLNELAQYDKNMKSYVHKAISNSGNSGVTDDDIQTTITEIINDLNA